MSSTDASVFTDDELDQNGFPSWIDREEQINYVQVSQYKKTNGDITPSAKVLNHIPLISSIGFFRAHSASLSRTYLEKERILTVYETDYNNFIEKQKKFNEKLASLKKANPHLYAILYPYAIELNKETAALLQDLPSPASLKSLSSICSTSYVAEKLRDLSDLDKVYDNPLCALETYLELSKEAPEKTTLPLSKDTPEKTNQVSSAKPSAESASRRQNSITKNKILGSASIISGVLMAAASVVFSPLTGGLSFLGLAPAFSIIKSGYNTLKSAEREARVANVDKKAVAIQEPLETSIKLLNTPTIGR